MVVAEYGAGPAVVLLHGQPGVGQDWERVVEALDGAVRLLVPDRPGYGRTGGPAGGCGANADAVIDLLDRAGIEHRPPSPAHSWAGAVALDLAQRHPDRVTAIVLVSSVGGPGSIGHLDRLLAAPVLGSLLAAASLTALRANRIRRAVATLAAPRDRTAVDSLAQGSFGPWRSVVAEQRALLHELPGISARLETEPMCLRSCSSPMPIGSSLPASQEPLAALAAAQSCEVVRMAGYGHLLPREAPGGRGCGQGHPAGRPAPSTRTALEGVRGPVAD